jgi:hypothetical protein
MLIENDRNQIEVVGSSTRQNLISPSQYEIHLGNPAFSPPLCCRFLKASHGADGAGRSADGAAGSRAAVVWEFSVKDGFKAFDKECGCG